MNREDQCSEFNKGWQLLPEDRWNAKDLLDKIVHLRENVRHTPASRYRSAHNKTLVYHVLEDDREWQYWNSAKKLAPPSILYSDQRSNSMLQRRVSIADHIANYRRHVKDSPYLSCTGSLLWAIYYLRTQKWEAVIPLNCTQPKTAYLAFIDLALLNDEEFFDMTDEEDRTRAFQSSGTANSRARRYEF